MNSLTKIYPALLSKFDDYIILTGSGAIKKYCEHLNIENYLIPNDLDFLYVSSKHNIDESTIYEFKRKQSSPERSVTFYNNNNVFDITIIKKCCYCVFNDEDGIYNIIDPYTLLSFYYDNKRVNDDKLDNNDKLVNDDYKIELLLKIIDINTQNDLLDIMTKASFKRKSLLDETENTTSIQKNIFSFYDSPSKVNYSSPAKVNYSSPLKVNYSSPAKVNYSSPLKVNYSSPAKLNYSSPANLNYDSPAKLNYSSPAKVNYDSPVKVNYMSLSKVNYSSASFSNFKENIENSPPTNKSRLSDITKSLF